MTIQPGTIVHLARHTLREAIAEVVPMDPMDGRIDELLANIEDLIDAKIEAAIRSV